jgi:uncharacterized membrane protein
MLWLLRKIGDYICHQNPQRSFSWYGTPFPLCARCTGIYLGLFLALLFAYWRYRRKTLTSLPAFYLGYFVIANLLMSLDVFSQSLRQPSSNLLRFLLGFLSGNSVGFLVYYGISREEVEYETHSDQ